jgi:hypothetical protein
MPELGLPGRCPVVPAGRSKYPVEELSMLPVMVSPAFWRLLVRADVAIDADVAADVAAAPADVAALLAVLVAASICA